MAVYSWFYLVKMVVFHSHVSLQEGKIDSVCTSSVNSNIARRQTNSSRHATDRGGFWPVFSWKTEATKWIIYWTIYETINMIHLKQCHYLLISLPNHRWLRDVKSQETFFEYPSRSNHRGSFTASRRHWGWSFVSFMTQKPCIAARRGTRWHPRHSDQR